jgi:glycine/serine hydroxymethyltransferase
MQSLLEKGYELVSGGTENHLVLVNLRNKVKEKIFLPLATVLFSNFSFPLRKFY